jgi:hypothetical protein
MFFFEGYREKIPHRLLLLPENDLVVSPMHTCARSRRKMERYSVLDYMEFVYGSTLIN